MVLVFGGASAGYNYLGDAELTVAIDSSSSRLLYYADNMCINNVKLDREACIDGRMSVELRHDLPDEPVDDPTRYTGRMLPYSVFYRKLEEKCSTEISSNRLTAWNTVTRSWKPSGRTPPTARCRGSCLFRASPA